MERTDRVGKPQLDEIAGKRLSEHSGKQAKEIRKLKAQTSQLETVTKARDSAVKELQLSQQSVQSHLKEIAGLKGMLSLFCSKYPEPREVMKLRGFVGF